MKIRSTRRRRLDPKTELKFFTEDFIEQLSRVSPAAARIAGQKGSFSLTVKAGNKIIFQAKHTAAITELLNTKGGKK